MMFQPSGKASWERAMWYIANYTVTVIETLIKQQQASATESPTATPIALSTTAPEPPILSLDSTTQRKNRRVAPANSTTTEKPESARTGVIPDVPVEMSFKSDASLIGVNCPTNPPSPHFSPEGSLILTVEEVAKHKNRQSCWIIIHDKVYDVTKFLAAHPGGSSVIVFASGRDATNSFESLHPTMGKARNLISQYCIGNLVQ